ncbi:hypothetical protein K440DRAFT_629355 [Wilcoxina mikolae CBS 423.85]|nr:hypothetical protein K440DRAFT_629355 [Wilcoxina mikolae CBS 423.85]
MPHYTYNTGTSPDLSGYGSSISNVPPHPSPAPQHSTSRKPSSQDETSLHASSAASEYSGTRHESISYTSAPSAAITRYGVGSNDSSAPKMWRTPRGSRSSGIRGGVCAYRRIWAGSGNMMNMTVAPFGKLKIYPRET